MAVSKSIVEWLKQCEYIQNGIDFELLGAGTDVYALSKVPSNIVETFIDGSQSRTEYYTLLARMDAQLSEERESNDQLLENLETWIDEQNMEGNLPLLEAKIFCDNIIVSSNFYLFETQENESIYSLTLEIKYRKEI